MLLASQLQLILAWKQTEIEHLKAEFNSNLKGQTELQKEDLYQLLLKSYQVTQESSH